MKKSEILDVRLLHHWFPTKNNKLDGDTKRVLHDINLKINKGEFVALVGPSGCGKSTLFRSILGTHPPCQGGVYLDEEVINKPTRRVGIVYQHYSLYDFLTTEKNVAFGPMLDQSTLPHRMFNYWKWSKTRKEHIEQSETLLVKLGLESAIGHYPAELSGGMRQRVAIAQALIMRPSVLLLDEPFGALDESTRKDLQKLLLELYQENIRAKRGGLEPPHTVIMITHELDEAFYVADRIVGLSQYWKNDNEEKGSYFGATVCYNKNCAVFHPDVECDTVIFEEQKEELLKAVFSKQEINPSDYVS